MLKVKLALDVQKIIIDNKDINKYESTLKDICNIAKLNKIEEDLYLLDERKDNIGANLLLMGFFKQRKLFPYIKEWKNYDDEENDIGVLEEYDMLRLCKEKAVF